MHTSSPSRARRAAAAGLAAALGGGLLSLAAAPAATADAFDAGTYCTALTATPTLAGFGAALDAIQATSLAAMPTGYSTVTTVSFASDGSAYAEARANYDPTNQRALISATFPDYPAEDGAYVEDAAKHLFYTKISKSQSSTVEKRAFTRIGKTSAWIKETEDVTAADLQSVGFDQVQLTLSGSDFGSTATYACSAPDTTSLTITVSKAFDTSDDVTFAYSFDTTGAVTKIVVDDVPGVTDEEPAHGETVFTAGATVATPTPAYSPKTWRSTIVKANLPQLKTALLKNAKAKVAKAKTAAKRLAALRASVKSTTASWKKGLALSPAVSATTKSVTKGSRATIKDPASTTTWKYTVTVKGKKVSIAGKLP